MPGVGVGALRAFLGAALLGLALAASASAEVYYGAGGGLYVPYDGEVGWSVMGELGADIYSKHMRLGADFQFTSQSRSLDLSGSGLGTFDSTLRSYAINALFRFMFNPDKFSPYVGGGGGISIIDYNHSGLTAVLIDQGVPAVLVSDSTVGIGAGLLFLVGLEWPVMTKSMNLFAEGRAGYTWEVSGNLDGLASNGAFSGFEAIVGLRMRY